MLTDEEKAQLVEFGASVNELNLNDRDEAVLRHFLMLISSWQLRAKLQREKAEKERTLKIEKGFSFANVEKRINEGKKVIDYAT